MVHELEAEFREWSKPPTATEDQRCTNAESVVRNAIRSYAPFATRNIEVFAQGSYRNGTNVRTDSDVDICVRCTDVCFTTVPAGYSDSSFGLVDATYTYAEFKDDVGKALNGYLGASAVSRGKKAFDLHENTYRVDADVVPTFEHRLYRVENGQYTYRAGTELRPDGGGRIVNWPHQNYDNGTKKNIATRTRFKKLVRVLKRLRYDMVAAKIAAAEPIPSYLVECLVWNAPESAFEAEDYADNLRAVLVHLYQNTQRDETCSEWGEVNEVKYLFRPGQPWTRGAVNAFLVAAWNRAGLK
jgi:Nucleotidyltransferase domain